MFIEVGNVILKLELIKCACPSVMRGVTIITFTDNTTVKYDMEFNELEKALKSYIVNKAKEDVKGGWLEDVSKND